MLPKRKSILKTAYKNLSIFKTRGCIPLTLQTNTSANCNHALMILTAPALDTLTKMANPDKTDEVKKLYELILYQWQ